MKKVKAKGAFNIRETRDNVSKKDNRKGNSKHPF